MSLKKIILVYLSILLSNNVAAGLKKDETSLKVIDLGNNFQKVTGTLAATRATDDKVARWIITNYVDLDARFRQYEKEREGALMYGKKPDNTSVHCKTDDIEMVRLLRHVKTDSYIEVIIGNFNNREFKCVDITIKNSSAYAPKQP